MLWVRPFVPLWNYYGLADSPKLDWPKAAVPDRSIG